MSIDIPVKHYHYVITAYEKEKKMMLLNSSEITVRATSEEDAYQLAKEMLVRPKYRIAKVWECFEDHELSQRMQMVQIEIQKKMYDLMKP